MKILLLIIINIYFSFGKNILELNNESFNKLVESNKYDKNKKLLVIFYTKNCKYCQEALNVLTNEIINKSQHDNKIDFGKVNCDLRENIWLNMRFNITRIPYIILVKGKYFYELNSNYDKYELDYFINNPKENKDMILIPNDISIVQKRTIVINYFFNHINDFFTSNFNISLNKNIIIFMLVLIFILFLWFMKWILMLCCYNIFLCKKYRKKTVEDVDQSAISSVLSGSKLSSKENGNSSESSELSEDPFNEEMEESEIKNICKEKND